MTTETILEVKGVSKHFGTIQALKNVSFELRRGEVMGVVGDNGAGKSTLMKVLFGAVVPDSGELILQGENVVFDNPRDAQRHGIAMIYQDLALFNNLNVALNVCAGREYKRRVLGIPFLDKKRMHAEARELLNQLKINIPSTTMLVEKMSGGQRQMVACARAIGAKSQILIMDEPTAALGVTEANTLLQLIARLRDDGLTIVMITQRIPDVIAIGDRVLVMKGGQCQGILDVKQCTTDDILDLIIRGRSAGTAVN